MIRLLEYAVLAILALCVGALVGLLVGGLIAALGTASFPILMALVSVVWLVTYVSSLDDY